MSSSKQPSCPAVYRNHQVVLSQTVDWPEGTRLLVTPALPLRKPDGGPGGHAIIVGFGLAGRYVADLLGGSGFTFTVLERNPVTVETQRTLGRQIIVGDATDHEALLAAGILEASIVALTIPDEEAVLKSTALARRLRPDVYIIARTNYSSKGMQATQIGADEVVKAEQAVAAQFYEKLVRHLTRLSDLAGDQSPGVVAPDGAAPN